MQLDPEFVPVVVGLALMLVITAFCLVLNARQKISHLFFRWLLAIFLAISAVVICDWALSW